ncbi:M28 family peptidase [Sediminibacter sp. Hel_I_10]|uniref:M28 family peptidase n=1 Tax=Sediminibacter sp. Hel_I_10 TaxID=1392490 RepID=UPI000478A24B|nr:M28 family peptidase [Sediminibacter sp. Hel_I_10]
MKLQLIALSLTLVGSCATLNHEQKIKQLQTNIVFEDAEVVSKYAETITADELKTHVYAFSSDAFEGRRSGEVGHHKAAHFLKNYYLQNQIASPFGGEHYFQAIPESFFSRDLKSSENVLAYIEGSEFPEEVLIISGHSDHEGFTDTEIYNGADDNGSGTSAIMEIAQAFKKATDDGFQPRRSILFLHLTGEEVGLKGSLYYTQHPVFAMKNTIADLNIDMIGRVDEAHTNNPNYIYIIGADRLSTELHYISEAANTQFTNLDLDYTFNAERDANRYYYRSDHYNFALQGVPVIFYFNGEHKDYHEPTDTAEKINYKLLQKRTQLIFSTAWYLVNTDKRIIVDQDY